MACLSSEALAKEEKRHRSDFERKAGSGAASHRAGVVGVPAVVPLRKNFCYAKNKFITRKVAYEAANND